MMQRWGEGASSNLSAADSSTHTHTSSNSAKMHFSTLFTLVAVAASAAAQTISGQYDCMPAGAYTLCQNLWGRCTSSQSYYHGTLC